MSREAKITFTSAGVLFFLAFGLCTTLIITTPQGPLPDPTMYEGIAANLANGKGYSYDLSPPYRPEISRTPFLPYSISLLYLAIGRNPSAVLWLNALYISLAIAFGYMIAWRLFKDRRIAIVGSTFAVLVPQVSGAANNILTEPPAMLLVALIILFILEWPTRCKTKWAPVHAAILAILCAGLTLNRTAMTISVLIVAAYMCLVCLKGRWKNPAAWLTVSVFCVVLGAPVLSWSARNHSVGLPFSPAPIGLYASRVFDMKRYKDIVWDKGQRLPKCNNLYMSHWKRHWGPKTMFDLEAQNRAWFEEWWDNHSDRAWKSMPYRFVNLFSSYRNSIYPSWPKRMRPTMSEITRWISRSFWMLSFIGLCIAWRNKEARWIWLISLVPLIVVHMSTVAHTRYVFPLLPVLIPFGSIPFVKLWDYLFSKSRSKPNAALSEQSPA